MVAENESANVNITSSYIDEEAQKLQQIIVLVIIMILTFIGNVTIIVVLLKKQKMNKQLSATKMFVLNLAIGDLAVCCICMTAELLKSAYREWLLGNIPCKLVMYAQTLTLTCTVFLILGMGYDRYIAICQPMNFVHSLSRAKRTIVGAWILASILAIPQVLIFVRVPYGKHSNGDQIYFCESKGYTAEWQRKVYLLWQTFVILIMPTLFISYCYINVAHVVWKKCNENIILKLPTKSEKKTNRLRGCKHCLFLCKNHLKEKELAEENNSEYGSLHTSHSTNVSKTVNVNDACNYEDISLRRCDKMSDKLSRAKIRSIKLTLCIIVSFVSCWTPYFIVNNVRVFTNYRLFNDDFTIKMVVNNLALLNSALDPLIYGYFSLKLSQQFCYRTSLGDRLSTLQQDSLRNEPPMASSQDSAIKLKEITSEDKITAV